MGVIVAWGRVPAVVVTLGTLAIYRGVLVDLSGAKTVTTDSLPQWLIDLPLVNVVPIGSLDIRALFMLALVIVVVFQIGTTYLSFARRFYAIGSNPEAAQLIGLPMKGVVFLAFVICGALSGLGGFMLLARFGNITVEAGTRPGAQRGRRGRRRRRQCLWRLRNGHGRDARRGDDRDA